MDGFEKKLKSAVQAFNFDDFILLPGLARSEPKDIKLDSRFSKNIQINVPLVSSPMDTVTEQNLAVALAKKGGIGVIHRNCTTEEELKMVKAVKNADNARVAAAVSPFDLQRAKQLSKYADALIIDVAHFHNVNVMGATKKIMNETNVDVIIGNLGTKEGVTESLASLDGVAGLRMGVGSGSICTTTDITRAGAPTLFAVAQAADALQEIGMDIPIIADGGIRTSGDIALAIAFGASATMLGYVFAGCRESPSELTKLNGKSYKLHRGMGSKGAREKRAVNDRYADSGGKNIAEGVEMMIPYSGELGDVVDELTAGLRAAIGYAGATDIMDMRKNSRVARIDTRNQKIENKAEDRKALLH